MNNVRYKIWYGDGCAWTDQDGPVSMVPARDVQVIAQADNEVGHIYLHSVDYYWWVEDLGWQGGDIFGLFDYLIGPGLKKVLFGRWSTNAEFQNIMRQAQSGDYLDEKSAWRRFEKR